MEATYPALVFVTRTTGANNKSSYRVVGSERSRVTKKVGA